MIFIARLIASVFILQIGRLLSQSFYSGVWTCLVLMIFFTLTATKVEEKK